MNGKPHVSLGWAAAAVLLVAIGATGSYIAMRTSAPQPVPPTSEIADPRTPVQTAKIVVTEKGYEPDKVTLRAGVPVRLTFVRTTDKTCGTEVVFPSLKINRPLPLNQAVDIEFTPAKSGDIEFACGMDMLTGVIVVQ